MQIQKQPAKGVHLKIRCFQKLLIILQQNLGKRARFIPKVFNSDQNTSSFKYIFKRPSCTLEAALCRCYKTEVLKNLKKKKNEIRHGSSKEPQPQHSFINFSFKFYFCFFKKQLFDGCSIKKVFLTKLQNSQKNNCATVFF